MLQNFMTMKLFKLSRRADSLEYPRPNIPGNLSSMLPFAVAFEGMRSLGNYAHVSDLNCYNVTLTPE